LNEGVAEDERTSGIWERMLRALTLIPEESVAATTPPLPTAVADERLRANAEERLREFAQAGGGVVLGRAAGIVLPGAYHVRLDGPRDARARQGMRIERLNEAEARNRLTEADRVRELYWRRLYRLDWRDLSLYHLALDSTAVDLDTVTELLATAVRAYWSY
jgi:cytidylate kinase